MGVLFEYKADPFLKTIYGKTALTWAVDQGHHFLQFVLEHYEKDFETLKEGSNQDAVDWIAKMNQIYKMTKEMFDLAQEGDLERLAKVVEEEGVNVDSRNEYLETAMYIAADNNHSHVVRWLCENNADYDIPEEYGYTPLIVASQNVYEPVVDALIEFDADPFLTTHNVPFFSVFLSLSIYQIIWLF